MIFSRYLALKSFQKLIDEAQRQGHRHQETAKSPVKPGGIPFTYGPLAYLLKNRTYLGRTHTKTSGLPASTSRSSRRGFSNRSSSSSTNRAGRNGRRHENGALLTVPDFLFDDRGQSIEPEFHDQAAARDIRFALVRHYYAGANTSWFISANCCPELEAKVLNAGRDRRRVGNEHPRSENS